jgi:cobalt-zinc-cadmium efflux system outer membrane protein
MQRHCWRLYFGLLFASACLAQTSRPARALTWQETETLFKANNPTLLAGQATIDESKADEITADLRPNPDFTFSTDGTQIAPHLGVWHPFSGTFFTPSLSYLHERDHKRELRLESAREGTAIAVSTQADLERTLLYTVRDAFIRVLQAKAVRDLTRENLAYYDKEIDINKQRLNAGAMSRVDFQRVEIQRVQYESDLETAEVDLRTAKIDLRALLRDRTPIEQFDVTGNFDFEEPVTSLADLHQIALSNRPDLKEAEQNIDQARTNHQLAIANGSTDPTFSGWWTHNASTNNPYAYDTIGASVSIPLRIFDRNQGDKAHTLIDIGRNQELRDAAQIAVLHDVDSAYATLESTLDLLRPYKSKYLKEAADIRDTISFSYLHGAASLLDFIDAQQEYRSTELNYLTLVGSYMSAANQLNLAVGREVIQ